MRFLAFSAIAVAFVATVTARFDLGRCRTDIPQVKWDDYDHAIPNRHRFSLVDRELQHLVNAFIQLGFKLPIDYECDDLVTIEPFKSMHARQKKADDDAGDDG